VKRSRRGRQNDDDDEDDNQEDSAADEWAHHEDQATKTKGRGGRGGNRGQATKKYVRPLSMAIVIDDCHRLGTISTPHHLHSPLQQESTNSKVRTPSIRRDLHLA
jgi:hypothetical protein